MSSGRSYHKIHIPVTVPLFVCHTEILLLSRDDENHTEAQMKFSFLPQEEHFFDLIEQSAHYLLEGAVVLEDLVNHFEDVNDKITKLGGIEHACDEIIHTTLDKLNKTFITPIDREDIHSLVIALDDVLDETNEAATRMVLFRIGKPRMPAIKLAAIITQQTTILVEVVVMLRNPKQFDVIHQRLIELHRLENEADEVMKHAIADLFANETNAIELLRWKEIYETLEGVTDNAEDVANVIEEITVKMS